GKVHPELLRVLKEFRSSAKPIGAVCIAPAILALAFPGEKLELTLGAAGEASAEVEKLGQVHVQKEPTGWHLDAARKIATTPAYMYDGAPLHEIFAGIRGMVGELCRL